MDAYNKAKNEKINLDNYFNQTVDCYSRISVTLEQYKNEPLIKPIHKDSVNKIEQVKNILWNILNNLKSIYPLPNVLEKDILPKIHISNSETRAAVFKLIFLVDKETVLRHYFKLIKERYFLVIKELLE